MPDRKDDPPGGRPEFEVAWYTKELGQSLQREMLRKQLERLGRRRTEAPAEEDAAARTDDTPQPDGAA
jgi:hypothetical protein